MLRKTEFMRSDFLWRAAASVTAVSGAFVLVVFLLLVINYLQVQAADPIDDLTLSELRDQYAAAPEQDPALAQRIRNLDLLTRKAFFTSQYHLRVGGLLLLGGVIVFLIAFKSMARWRPELPEPQETPAAEEDWLSRAAARQVLTWTGVALLAGGLFASYMTESVLLANPPAATGAEEAAAPGEAAPAEQTDPPDQAFPDWETVSRNWPAFRGPGGLGVAHYTNAPMDWDVPAGKGVRWKAPVPLPGANSPVVWEKRLFLSGANEQKREVYCYDTESGELVWQRTLKPFPNTPAEPPDVSEDTGYAASTMAAHGGQVFAIFANGDVVSYDHEGNLVWGRALGLPANHYGHSSSLLAYENLLYIQFDESEKPRLIALNAATGEDAWVTQRELISWASPILAHTPFGPQLILCSEEDVDGYDPMSGKLLWSEECLGGEVAPSAAYAAEIVFAANEYAMASAIQLSGVDGAVRSELLWEYDNLLPEVSSPVGDGRFFYFATSFGDFVCLDAKTGEEAWSEEIGEGFYSSPVLVGDRIYILDNEGSMFVFQAGPEYKVLATLPVGEPTFATPAFLDGRIYLRTLENLYCIE